MKDFKKYKDEKLLELLLSESPECDRAFDAIYERYSARLNTYCIFRTSSREDAEEIFEDSWLNFLSSVRSGKKLDAILPFLLTIARNLTIDRFRKKNAKKFIEPELFDSFEIDKNISPFDLQEYIENQDLIAIIRTAANCLDEIYREVFVLRWFSGLSLGEISKLLGISRGSAKMRSHRAMKEMIKLMKPYFSETS